MPNDGSGPSFSSMVGTGMVLGWLGLRAYELYDTYRRTTQLTEEQRQQQEHVQEQLQHGQGGVVTRVIRQGPVTYTFTYGGGGGGGELPPEALLGLPGMDGLGGIDMANLQLSMMDRDFTEADYEMLLTLDRGGSAARPVSQEQMDRLPHHTYSQRDPGPQAGSSTLSAAATALRRPAGASAAAVEVPTCSICLEDFSEGSQVLALPCMHQYHVDCMEPWLKQQGSACTCPCCKSPVFPP